MSATAICSLAISKIASERPLHLQHEANSAQECALKKSRMVSNRTLLPLLPLLCEDYVCRPREPMGKLEGLQQEWPWAHRRFEVRYTGASCGVLSVLVSSHDILQGNVHIKSSDFFGTLKVASAALQKLTGKYAVTTPSFSLACAAVLSRGFCTTCVLPRRKSTTSHLHSQ